jgi:hypothetical protein
MWLNCGVILMISHASFLHGSASCIKKSDQEQTNIRDPGCTLPLFAHRSGFRKVFEDVRTTVVGFLP